MSMMFLELIVDSAPVKGDSTTAGFEGQIEVESMDWEADVEQPEDAKSSSGTKARSHFKGDRVKLSKYFDSASTALFSHMYNRVRISEARVTVTTMVLGASTGADENMLVVELEDCWIESIDARARETGKAMAVTESLTLSFKKCVLSYYALDPTSLRRDGAALTFTHVVEASTA